MIDNMEGALGREDAAKYLAVSTRTVDKLVANGKLLKAKIGSKTVFIREELDRFLKSCLVGNGGRNNG